MLDNMLAIHARNPFVPPREILVEWLNPILPQLQYRGSKQKEFNATKRC
jgi:hypothetical protein